MCMADAGLSIGDVAARTGLAVSAIRFYEERGLVRPWRDDAGRRRFARADIRRISIVMAAQQFGFTLEEIAAQLAPLPRHRAPSKADWTRMAQTFRAALDARITRMERLRDTLDGCIGCGCLSLEACALYNPGDTVGAEGPGPRRL
ncbi:MAG: redox-sensitive transcriptional activator SoxR [Pseudomonadota bacterium]